MNTNLQSRNKDFSNIIFIKNKFSSIKTIIKNLNSSSNKFEKLFLKQNNHYCGFEFENKIFVFFLDRKLFNIKSKLNAKAVRVWNSETDYTTKQYEIYVYFDKPNRVKNYNKWFVKNLSKILDSQQIESSFVHEYTHIMDYMRVKESFLVNRTKRKNSLFEINSSKKDFKDYANDSLELNAYFNQGINDVIEKLNSSSIEEKFVILGNHSSHFVKNMFSNWFRPTFVKNLNKRNIERISKRVSLIWNKLWIHSLN